MCQPRREPPALPDAPLRVMAHSGCPDARAEPRSPEAHDPPRLAPVAYDCAPWGSVSTGDVSTALCLHDPADALLPAPRAEGVQGLRGATPGPTAIRAVVNVRCVDRCQPPPHRSLDHLGLERRTDRAVSSVCLLNPDTLHGRRLLTSTAEALVEVAQVLVEMVGILLSWHSRAPRCARLPRGAGCLGEQGSLKQGSQGGQHPLGLGGGLRPKALQLWGDGWCSQGISRRAVPLHVLPGFACPAGERLGFAAPPSAVLCSTKTAPCPSRNPSLGARTPIPCLLPWRSGYPPRARDRGAAPRSRPGLGSPAPSGRD